ncbi:MAG: 5-formyltetrahydrofolate cyclo-ligase [Phycisphaerales bacterium]|nr:5-formyltetrahydrofolate cyclo-ligase [Phycisphaerales bacterium]
MAEGSNKTIIRKQLREKLAAMSPDQRRAKSIAACDLIAASPEFHQAWVIMLFLSTSEEVDTAPLALRAWQAGKTVVVPKVSWDQKRILPVEINSLQTGLTVSGTGVREPVAGKPVPLEFIDLVIVPGLGFTEKGHRIGRGMGFYDRFLAQSDFMGLSCGLCFQEQVVSELPMLDHDMPLSMLVSDHGIRRFSTSCIRQP